MDTPAFDRYFTLAVPLYGYPSAVRQGRGAYQLLPGRVYEATQVARQHLVVTHPALPSQVLYVPLPSQWHWDRVTLSPATLDLAALGQW